ncbi:MAG TPA: 4-alpha-glucanotransferase [Candidatus Binataceae bacterium]|nr:4-alpha-glucanotransferase [Candidatus Binataceae bacterium]
MLPRSAGILIPLFSLRSRNDLGRGEIGHVRAMVDFAIAAGHRVILLLPLDETAPSEASPYSAMSLFAIDPLYISGDEIGESQRKSSTRIGRDRSPRLVPRSRYVKLKREILERGFQRFEGRASGRERHAFEDFILENAYWIADYALFRALKDRYEFASWETWPAELAHREPSALDAARRELAEPIRKYAWFQFAAHRQWQAAREYANSRGVYLGGDLAFSPGRDSAEVWAHREMFSLERSIGTPPDAFAEKGQRWGLPMPNWEVMRAGRFALWRSRMRHAATLYDLVRIDHVVGIYRTFSFDSEPDTPGVFYPEREEDQRAQGESVIRAIQEEARGATIIAEDLGTVLPWVRASLSSLGIGGYKVMQWEREWDTEAKRFISPREYPEVSLATTATHDTDALKVWWRAQAESDRAALIAALELNGRVSPRADLIGDRLDAVIEALYAGASRLAILSIQDLFGWSARINRPGTVRESNWTYRLPMSLDRMAQSPAIRARQARLREIAIRTGRFEEIRPGSSMTSPPS